MFFAVLTQSLYPPVSLSRSSATHGLRRPWWLHQHDILSSVWRRPHCCSRLREHHRFIRSGFKFVVVTFSVLIFLVSFCSDFLKR